MIVVGVGDEEETKRKKEEEEEEEEEEERKSFECTRLGRRCRRCDCSRLYLKTFWQRGPLHPHHIRLKMGV